MKKKNILFIGDPYLPRELPAVCATITLYCELGFIDYRRAILILYCGLRFIDYKLVNTFKRILELINFILFWKNIS